MSGDARHSFCFCLPTLSSCLLLLLIDLTDKPGLPLLPTNVFDAIVSPSLLVCLPDATLAFADEVFFERKFGDDRHAPSCKEVQGDVWRDEIEDEFGAIDFVKRLDAGDSKQNNKITLD